jgi:hypothetical protein
MKMFRETVDLVKTEKYRVLYINPQVGFIVSDDINLS